MMIQAILFDLWETLGTKGFSISKEFQRHFEIKDYLGYLQDYEKSIQLTKWNSKEDMARNFLKTFNLSLTQENIEYVIGVYNRGIEQAKLFDGAKEILIKLKQKYKLGLASNTTNFEINFVDKFDIRKLFDAIICSHDVGELKPSRKIFEAIASKLSVQLNECLFIDDSLGNIEKAREYGLKTIHFENIKQLKKELTKF